MKQFLLLINGKKTLIVGVLCVIVSYLQAKGWIGNDETLLFQGIITALGFTASVATHKLK